MGSARTPRPLARTRRMGAERHQSTAIPDPARLPSRGLGMPPRAMFPPLRTKLRPITGRAEGPARRHPRPARTRSTAAYPRPPSDRARLRLHSPDLHRRLGTHRPITVMDRASSAIRPMIAPVTDRAAVRPIRPRPRSLRRHPATRLRSKPWHFSRVQRGGPRTIRPAIPGRIRIRQPLPARRSTRAATSCSTPTMVRTLDAPRRHTARTMQRRIRPSGSWGSRISLTRSTICITTPDRTGRASCFGSVRPCPSESAHEPKGLPVQRKKARRDRSLERDRPRRDRQRLSVELSAAQRGRNAAHPVI